MKQNQSAVGLFFPQRLFTPLVLTEANLHLIPMMKGQVRANSFIPDVSFENSG